MIFNKSADLSITNSSISESIENQLWKSKNIVSVELKNEST